VKAWFRMYGEFVSDPKVQLLAFEDQRHFVALLCLKCNGTLDSEAPSQVFRDRMIAKALGLSPDAALEAKRRLIEVGVVQDDWQPVKWSERQFESDSSTDRVRKFRGKRSGNVSVTPQNRADTEQTQIRSEPAVAGLDLAAWSAWVEYRIASRKPLKPASIPAAQRKLAAFGREQAAVVEHCIANGYQGLYAPNSSARPTTKAQQRQDSTIAAGLAFLNGGEPQ
jgi:hypothetical protein